MRVAIVNDMGMAAEILRRIVTGLDGCEVAWIARDGQEAVERCATDTPDLILMDLVMPRMDGVEATRRIMQSSPCPILLVTASVTGNSNMVYEALGHGARDAVATPSLGASGGTGGAGPLIRKIEQLGLMSGVRISASIELTESREPGVFPPMVAIGASTGGPKALASVLAAFPRDLNATVVIVQHVDEQFAGGLADWLGQSVLIPVEIARRGESPRAGVAYLAATNDHLLIDEDGTFQYTERPRELAYRPSVDVFFESVRDNWHGPVVGVLLTGMGRDGAEGLLALREAGHPTIAQDEATSVVYGMPKAARQNGGAAAILPVEEIGAAVLGELRH